MDFQTALSEFTHAKISFNEPMKKHTTLKVGGNADCLVLPENIEDVKNVLTYAKQNNIPLTIVGNGSKLLVKDGGIRGIVIKFGSKFGSVEIVDEYITAYAGVTLPKLAIIAKDNSLSGLEFASGIPGNVGGAIYMNAGAYNATMEDIICDVTYLTEIGNLVTISKDEMDLKYRSSIFKEMKGIIVSATIELNKAFIKEMPLEKIATYKKNKKDTQPINVLSAGSTFKNIENKKAWKIIDNLGFRGYEYKNVMVSNHHTNFIINKGNATYQDMIELIDLIKKESLEKYNINLECEWEIIE